LHGQGYDAPSRVPESANMGIVNVGIDAASMLSPDESSTPECGIPTCVNACSLFSDELTPFRAGKPGHFRNCDVLLHVELLEIDVAGDQRVFGIASAGAFLEGVFLLSRGSAQLEQWWVASGTNSSSLTKISGRGVFDEPYDALRHSVPAFLEQIDYQRQRAVVIAEAVKFKNVLRRKKRQLLTLDEYDYEDWGPFKKELASFAKKRLPGISAEIAESVLEHWARDLCSNDEIAGQSLVETMSGRDFEQFCEQQLTALSWRCRRTAATGDQGVDLICERNGVRLVVQCKHYTGPVGNAAVQEVIAARAYEAADRAAVVISSSFTRSARDLASATGVVLLHYSEIADSDQCLNL